MVLRQQIEHLRLARLQFQIIFSHEEKRVIRKNERAFSNSGSLSLGKKIEIIILLKLKD